MPKDVSQQDRIHAVDTLFTYDTVAGTLLWTLGTSKVCTILFEIVAFLEFASKILLIENKMSYGLTDDQMAGYQTSASDKL